MTRKKIIQKQPIEKLSSDAIVEITESSSSEEESDLTPIIKPKAVKKPRSDKQLANDQRLRDRKKKVEPVINDMDIVNTPSKTCSCSRLYEDKTINKANEMHELMSQMNQPKPVVKKPRKPRASKAEMAARKSEKIVNETPPPPPPPPPLVRAKPQMLFV